MVGAGAVPEVTGTAEAGSETGAAIGTGLGAGGAVTGLMAQALSHTLPTMAWTHQQTPHMVLILLEALFAGMLFVGIIWWTMFSGRKGGELPRQDDEEQSDRMP